MKKLLSIGVLLSLSIGSALAITAKKPAFDRGFTQPRISSLNTVSKAVAQDRLAIGKARVAGLKTQTRVLKKEAPKSPVVRSVLERKQEKLMTAEKAVKKATTDVKKAVSAPVKKVGSWFK